MEAAVLSRARNTFAIGSSFTRSFQLSLCREAHDPLHLPLFDATMLALPQL
jgi:hypothetical protein